LALFPRWCMLEVLLWCCIDPPDLSHGDAPERIKLNINQRSHENHICAGLTSISAQYSPPSAIIPGGTGRGPFLPALIGLVAWRMRASEPCAISCTVIDFKLNLLTAIVDGIQEPDQCVPSSVPVDSVSECAPQRSLCPPDGNYSSISVSRHCVPLLHSLVVVNTR
jgi:hypothetical protein